jgi:hypothetical protein
MGKVQDFSDMGEKKKLSNFDKESKDGPDYDSCSLSSISKPSMPPPPYFETHFIKLSSLEAGTIARRNQCDVSLSRLALGLLQFAFALASGISYAIELDHRYSASTTNFIYAEVVFGLTLLTLIIECITVRYYRFVWAVEWTLAILWIVCFSLFYGVYLSGEPPADYAVVDFGRMRLAGWCNLFNAVLWLASALFSSVKACSEIKATGVKVGEEKVEEGRQKTSQQNQGDGNH